MKRTVVAIALLALIACYPDEEITNTPPHYKETIEAWRVDRAKRLASEDSWLSLVGLFWLQEGANDINIPNAPPHAGTISLANGKLTLTPAVSMTINGQPVAGPTELLPDTDDKGPTIVQLATTRFHIIKRKDRYGIRAKDPNSLARKNFKGLEWYAVDPKWRIEAVYEPYAAPKKIAITDVLGQTNEMTSPGALVFTIGGQTYRIDPVVEPGEKDFFIIMKDATSRDTTYPAARYLYASPPGPDHKVILDFNKAYNPPCAFTPFATCPLPPPQNRLPIRVEAGEKRYAGGHA